MVDVNENSKPVNASLPLDGDGFDGARKRLAAIVYSKRRDEENDLYNHWVHQYDQDMEALGFKGYIECRKKVAELLPDKSTKILDLGCGTGKFGEMLNSLGYTNLYGMDANSVFVEKSREKNVYLKLENMNLSPQSRAPYSDGYFDAVIAISVIGPHSVDQTILPEVSRLIKPGGYLIAFMRKTRLEMELEDYKVKSFFENWVSSGQWQRLPDVCCDFYRGSDRQAEDDAVVESTGAVVTFQKM